MTSAVPAQRRLRQVIGWGTGLFGLALLMLTYLGLAIGFTVLPFDRHHVVGQLAGILIGVMGVSFATRK